MALPDPLAGTWTTRGENSYTAYRLDPDGVYGMVAMRWEERDSGFYRFVASERGVVTPDGRSLRFEPVDAWRRSTDPDDPSKNVDRSADPTPTTRHWAVSPNGESLELSGEDGTLRLQRQGLG